MVLQAIRATIACSWVGVSSLLGSTDTSPDTWKYLRITSGSVWRAGLPEGNHERAGRHESDGGAGRPLMISVCMERRRVVERGRCVERGDHLGALPEPREMLA